MTKELAIKILIGDVLGTNEQTHEAVKMAVKALVIEPVKHGKWIDEAEDWRKQIEWYKCSQCDFPTFTAYNYCPHCGAIMDENEISNIARESADKISKALEKVRAKGMQKQNIKEGDKP